MGWTLNDSSPVDLAQTSASVPAPWSNAYWGGPSTMDFSAVPTDALAATPVGVGKATGALSVAHALAANGIGVGNASGALSLTHLLASGAIGVGRASGALSVAHLLAAAATGTGLASATISTGAAAVLVPSPAPASGADGAMPHKRRPPAPFISAQELAAIQPVKVTRVPEWLLDAFLRGEVEEEEFAVLVALQ